MHINLSSPRLAKTVPLVILLCLPLGGKGLTVPSYPSSSLTFPLPDRPKPYSLLFYCLTPDDFTRHWRASGRVKKGLEKRILDSFLAKDNILSRKG